MPERADKRLSATDRKLLNLLQSGFPCVSRPFAALGEKLGLSEQEVLERIAGMKEAGIIRRIGGVFDSEKLGFVSTLAALSVKEDLLDDVAEIISRHPGVTHNYRREHEYNLWFTLVTASREEQDRFLAEAAGLAGVRSVRNLPAIKLFKIGVNFDMAGDASETE